MSGALGSLLGIFFSGALPEKTGEDRPYERVGHNEPHPYRRNAILLQALRARQILAVVGKSMDIVLSGGFTSPAKKEIEWKLVGKAVSLFLAQLHLESRSDYRSLP